MADGARRVVVDGGSLTLASVAQVARGRPGFEVPEAARAKMARSRAWVLGAARGEVTDAEGTSLTVYGVNTGYGSLARVRIAAEHIEQLSMNLVRSHAAGVGRPVAAPVVRAMMLLRANALAKGASGCAPELVHTLLAMLEADVSPVVPQQGSCGSSGDLAPLAHLGLVVFRGADEGAHSTGWAWFGGERLPGAVAMSRAGIDRLVPGPKDGLAMTNGAQLSTAYAALACFDAASLLSAATIAAALSFEALRGVTRALHPAVHALRPYPGAIAVASDLRRLLAGSTFVDSLPDKVQDAYALRCSPQVLGSSRDGVTYAAAQIGVELNAATDNPLVLVDEPDVKAFSAGLFHGEPVGMAADHLKLAVSEVAALAERRIYRLTTGTLSARLPPLLAGVDRPGVGLLAPQTTAAALVSENRALAYPASADSIPTCEDQEDHVAMSTTAARRASEVVENTRRVVAIELLTASVAIGWRLREEGGQLGAGTAPAFAAVQRVLGEAPGRSAPSDQLALLEAALIDGSLVAEVEAAVGALAEVPGGR